ncbi:MAG: hypothetical protein M1550_01905 [Deltaproteobacteria bacterium]|nr:hypothetical protein [Deltaproteobacteria bacterium]
MKSPRTYCVWILVIAAAAIPFLAGPSPAASKDPAPRKTAPANVARHEFPVPPPPFSEGIFPCSDCHKEMKPNPKRRVLTEEHTNIVLNHGPGRWCLDCHDLANRDRLHLISGEKIDFSESYRLCGQCHGDKYRDWKVGVHGKRTGYWNGKKEYLLCAHCHNPHDPRFKPLSPMPPPVRPEHIR